MDKTVNFVVLTSLLLKMGERCRGAKPRDGEGDFAAGVILEAFHFGKNRSRNCIDLPSGRHPLSVCFADTSPPLRGGEVVTGKAFA
jgi:hypothetical protein